MGQSLNRRKDTDLNLAGYNILEGLTDPLTMPQHVLNLDQVKILGNVPESTLED